jgi:hypothetical protein
MLTQEEDVELNALVRGAGRSPRSLLTWAGTARPCAHTSGGDVNPAGASRSRTSTASS